MPLRSATVHKELREIVRQLQANGYAVMPSGKHQKVKDQQDRTVYTLPTTPGGGRWRQNLIADLRRKGLIE